MRIPFLIASGLIASTAQAAPLVANSPILTRAGAIRALNEAETRAIAADAPSAIAIVDVISAVLVRHRLKA